MRSAEAFVPKADTVKLLGQTIAGKYAIESIVGEGGFAVVYRATHLIWKRPVAIKIFKVLGDFSESDRQKLFEQFVQEASLLADLSARTAAIVQARDIGMLDLDGGHAVPYMVLEWLEGSTLEAVLATERQNKIPLRTIQEVVHLLDPVAEALALAHRKGVAHRDVKPGNVFVLPDGTVKLLDFGIAKVVSDAQRIAGSFAKTNGSLTSFTPAYGAPEQFSRTVGPTGPWSDVFALALIVVETLTGREALEGDDYMQLARASADPERRPTPRTLGGSVSDGAESVVTKALGITPADRWQSAGEFWTALRQAVALAMHEVSKPERVSLQPSSPQGRRDSIFERETLVHAPGVSSAKVIARSDPTTPPAVATLSARSRKPGLFAALAIVSIVSVTGAVLLVGRSAGPPTTIANVRAMPVARVSVAATSATAALATPRPPCPAGTISIPGGSFFMGSDDGLPFERPSHEVTLAPFCMDQFEVTVDKYKACSDAGRCKRAGSTNEWAAITDMERKVFDATCNIRDPEERGKHPINCVDWDMADRYCREQGDRLPTEAEWEFAARGPDGRKYPWGDDDPSAGSMNACGKECVAWGATNGVKEKAMYDADDGFPTTAPVGSFPKGASRYGVQDVVGNVWEWVADWYGPYASTEQRDPGGPPAGDERVIRGGSWNGSYATWVRPTFRYKEAPTNRSSGIGFRCAK
jgi:eukaryotic-like serine/threonine-protein kinase